MQAQANSYAERFANMVKHLSDVDPAVVRKEESIKTTSPYQERVHIEPHSGTQSDPNGFAFFNGQYHLFYQWTPLAFAQPSIWHHGWYHLASSDLVHWQQLGGAIESDTKYDKHGTYSGSGIAVGDKLFLMYTGNTWTKDWQRVPYQLGAVMDKNGKFAKDPQPLISGPLAGYTGHFRDPKVWQATDGKYYAVLGAQRQNLTGSALVYTSSNLTEWQPLGEIKTHTPNFGFMWECPDYFEIDGQGVLLFSPQGLQPEGDKYQNIYQTGVFVGAPLNMRTLEFNHGQFQELDAGFDFYATQTILAPDGRRILTAWFGLPEMDYATDQYHYSGALVFPRELSLVNGQVRQQPVREIDALRHNEQNIDAKVGPRYELSRGPVQEFKLNVNIGDAARVIIDLRADQNNEHSTRLIIDKKNQRIVLNRSKSGAAFNKANGTVRERQLHIDEDVSLDIIMDTSSVEIFVNGGALVFSARIFPGANQVHNFIQTVSGTSTIKGHSWTLAE